MLAYAMVYKLEVIVNKSDSISSIFDDWSIVYCSGVQNKFFIQIPGSVP
jgi:hypothetical protein